jgi:hypothetical protein
LTIFRQQTAPVWDYFTGYDLNLYDDTYKYFPMTLNSKFISLSIKVDYDEKTDTQNN